MKPIMLLSCFALATLGGCVNENALRMGGENFTPNVPDNVLLLEGPPSWPYAEIGYVQSQAGPFATDIKVYRSLQEVGAEVGADAVIMDVPFMKYPGRDDEDWVSRVTKGRAIVRVDEKAKKKKNVGAPKHGFDYSHANND